MKLLPLPHAKKTCFAILVSLMIHPLCAQSGKLGLFEEHGDVGSPSQPGSASYDSSSQTYSLKSAGTNMWYARDEFHFVWKQMKGDFLLRARVSFPGKGTDPHRKMGLLLRTSLDPDSAYADTAVHGDGLTSLQFRRTKGANTEEVRCPVQGVDVVQLERKGAVCMFSAAKFGEPLQSCQVTNLVLGDSVYAGLFLCSHNAQAMETGVFQDVRIVRPAQDNFVPYKDYLGSHLEILDIQTGRTELLLSSAQPFEAPNWTVDGQSLIYNGSGKGENSGRLFRFDLAKKESTPIDTGFANRNNNDHVISFDGKSLGISHHSKEDGGQSVIYTLPIGGGTPTRVTKLAPSYLHGWSPDGKYLVYTGGRNNRYNIYKIPAQGGEEVRLTDADALDDGPEYSPDGKFIYFNSSRSGTMQLWRMKPDGTGQEQLTNDRYNNWFPHVSPDGKWIAFLSYAPEVAPKDHPYYKHVYLRLRAVDGGEPKVLGYVYGGQGTINVPSWSPDSRKIAFVSNSAMD